MKRIAWVVGLSALAVLVGPHGVCGAAEEEAHATDLVTAFGTITSVALSEDLHGGVITMGPSPGVSTITGPAKFLVTDHNTAISKGGVRLRAADLQASEERVTIQYVPEGDRPAARMLTFEKPADLLRASGTIESIDLLKGEVVLGPGGFFSGRGRQAFTVNERTLVVQGEARSYLMNLTAGEPVLIEYTIHQDAPVAYVITGQAPQWEPLVELRGRSPESKSPAPGTAGHIPSRQ